MTRLIAYLLRRKKSVVKKPVPLGRFFVERVKFFNSGRRVYFNQFPCDGFSGSAANTRQRA